MCNLTLPDSRDLIAVVELNDGKKMYLCAGDGADSLEARNGGVNVARFRVNESAGFSDINWQAPVIPIGRILKHDPINKAEALYNNAIKTIKPGIDIGCIIINCNAGQSRTVFSALCVLASLYGVDVAKKMIIDAFEVRNQQAKKFVNDNIDAMIQAYNYLAAKKV